MKKYQCEHYEPWRKTSDLVQMDECEAYVYVSGRCSNEESEHYNQDCVFPDGTPGEGYPLADRR